jgi:hypothetical protein
MGFLDGCVVTPERHVHLDNGLAALATMPDLQTNSGEPKLCAGCYALYQDKLAGTVRDSNYYRSLVLTEEEVRCRPILDKVEVLTLF